MMIAAKMIPIKIARDAFLISNSNKEAIREPVHAPVPGSGIPTNSNRKINSPFSTPLDFFAALSSNLYTKFFKILCFFINSKIFLINNRINGIGRIFPRIQIIFAYINGTFSKDAIISPPRNSIRGSIDTRKIKTSFGIKLPNEF